MIPLPIDPYVPAVVAALRERGAAVVVAPPGAGKTTRVPPALCAAYGAAFVLQPRRVAARALARRIADEQGLTLGRGGRLAGALRAALRAAHAPAGGDRGRADRAARRPTRCSRASATVVLDEFHERRIHADLALALVKQAARARSELRIVVMSATLDAGAVAAFLDGCPVVEAEAGRIRSRSRTLPASPSATPCAGGCATALATSSCFLPGAGEIRRAASELSDVARGRAAAARRPRRRRAGRGAAPVGAAQGGPGHEHRRDRR